MATLMNFFHALAILEKPSSRWWLHTKTLDLEATGSETFGPRAALSSDFDVGSNTLVGSVHASRITWVSVPPYPDPLIDARRIDPSGQSWSFVET